MTGVVNCGNDSVVNCMNDSDVKCRNACIVKCRNDSCCVGGVIPDFRYQESREEGLFFSRLYPMDRTKSDRK